MRRPNWIISMGLLFLAALALSSVEVLYLWKVEPILEAHLKTLKKHFKLYSEDVRFVSRFDLFYPPKTGTRDAGAVLNARVFWTPLLPFVADGRRQIVSPEAQEILLRAGNDWIRSAFKLRNIQTDLSLFDAINSFDYWDIETTGPIAQLIQANRFVPPANLPVPDPLDLIAASKIRLINGTKDGNPLAALRQVRQLAQLLLTTENLQLYIAGLAIFEDERRAYRHYVDELGLPKDAWEPFDRNVTRRARRSALATRGYIHVWTPEDEFKEIFLSGEGKPNGLCAAVNEALPIEMTLRPQLEPHWPLERDFRKNYAHLDQLFERTRQNCRLRYFSKLMETSNFSAPLPGPLLLNRLPYWRKLFAMKASVQNFTGFDEYDQLLINVPDAGNGP